MDHGTYEQLAAGAALDDLGPAERLDLSAHLAGCAACRSVADDLDAVTADLALVAPQRRPPDSLRVSIMAAIAQPSPASLVAAVSAPAAVWTIETGTAPARSGNGSAPPPTSDLARPSGDEVVVLRREARRSRSLALVGLAVAAALAIAVAGLGVRTVQLDGELTTARAAAQQAQADLAQRATAMSGAMAVAVDPAHVTTALHAEKVAPSATALVLYQPGTPNAYLMATDLPATPAGQVYQLWVADGTGVHALGTYHYDGNGAFVAPIGRDLRSASATMVTLEPEGGAQGQPGPQVVFGEL